MLDHSLHDTEPLKRPLRERARTAVDVRIPRCDGLIPSCQRCRRARRMPERRAYDRMTKSLEVVSK